MTPDQTEITPTPLPTEFDLEEACWRFPDGNMEPILTAITALEDEREFEKWLFLIRKCRELSGFSRVG